MSGTTSRRSARDPSLSLDERLKILYPMVNEDETPLPKGWSGKDKGRYIGLGLLEKVSIYSTAPKKEVNIFFSKLNVFLLELSFLIRYTISETEVKI